MKAVIIPPDAFNVSDRINVAEMDLNMENVRTMVTTIVSIRRPNHDSILLSEKLLFSTSLNDSHQMETEQDRRMNELRENFYSQRDLVCLGKLVPNLIRDQDNLILEVMLPAELEIEANLREAARMLAPFLIVSNHMIFNFDEADLKTSLITSVQTLTQATSFLNFSALKEYETDDLEQNVSLIMPQLFFKTCFSVQALKKQYKLRNACEHESQILDCAIHSFMPLATERQFYSLFKRRYLLSPALTSTRTPNTSMEFQQRKRADAAASQLPTMADEIVERLLPKIFDDV